MLCVYFQDFLTKMISEEIMVKIIWPFIPDEPLRLLSLKSTFELQVLS